MERVEKEENKSDGEFYKHNYVNNYNVIHLFLIIFNQINYTENISSIVDWNSICGGGEHCNKIAEGGSRN